MIIEVWRERGKVFFFKWAFICSRTVLLEREKIGENSPFGVGGDDERQCHLER